LKDSAKKFFGHVFNPIKGLPVDTGQVNDAVEKSALSIMNNPKISPVIVDVEKRTSNIGMQIRSAVQLMGSRSPFTKALADMPNSPIDIPQVGDTFTEVYEANKAAKAGNTSKLKEFYYQLESTIPQTLIGVALNYVPYVGKPLSYAYWATLSAGDQIENKGEVTSLTNVEVDVVLDRVLGKTIESIFKAPAKSLLSTIKQTFVAEGGTEVAQDLLKLSNDYLEAKTEADRQKAIQAGKDYFTSGQILMTAGVGGLTGAGIGAGAHAINQNRKQIDGVTGVTPPPPGGTESILAEARKYKSAEEFVKGQGTPVFRGGTPIDLTMGKKVGISVSTDKGVADRFAGYNKGGISEELRLSPDAKILDANNITASQIKADRNEVNIIKYARDNNYDAIDFTKSLVSDPKLKGIYLPESEIRILNPEKLKTKSQLTEIWNEGQKGTAAGTEIIDKDIQRPGFQKFSKYLDTAVSNGTFAPEEATILRTIFEGTNDELLANLKMSDNSRLRTATGNFNAMHLPNSKKIAPNTAGIEMRKGLFNEGNYIPSRTFVHEFGHAGWYLVLSEEERATVKKVFNGIDLRSREQLFTGLGSPSSANYYAKSSEEFFAQSFSDYVFENKVSAPQMESLLKRVAKIFYKNIKKLVERKQPEAVRMMSPIFEKILAGDKSTPLSEFAASEPPSFKNELKKLLSEPQQPEVPASKPIFAGQKTTKEVPVETLLPPGDTPLETASLTPDISETVEPLEVVAQGEKRTPVSEKVNILDKLRTPWRVLEKLGARQEYQGLIKAYEAYAKELPGNIDTITAWSKQVPKESNERIFRFLDGEEIALNAEELRVAGEIKTWLSGWADRLGMEKDARLSDYITHIFPLGRGGEIPEEIATIIDKKVAKSIYDPFLLHRKGAEGYKKDTWAALDAYVKRATRKVNIDQALEEFNKATAHLTEVSQLNYIEKRVSALNMRPTEAETSVDNLIRTLIGDRLGARPTLEITRMIRKMIAGAKIGGSLTSFAKNLTQGVNTFSDLKTRYTLRGYLDLVKFGGKELNDNSVLISPFIEDRTYSAVKKWAEQWDNILFLNMQASELVNRGAAYYGAKAKFLDGKITPKEFRLGLGRDMPANYTPTLEDAVDYGKFVAEKTQFRFGPLDAPAAITGPIARTAAQFQTFGIKQTEFILNMITDKEYAKLIRYIVSSMFLFQFIGSAFGMKWDDSFKTLRWGMPPAIQFLIDLYNNGVLGEDKYGNTLDVGQRVAAVGKSLFTNIVPMGAQIERGYQGVKAVSEGAVRSPSGTLLYRVNQNPLNYVRGALFGKYNLPETKAYYKKKEDREKGKSDSGANRFKGL
jgi:hypothetical protein